MSNVVSFGIYSQTSTQLLPCHCQPSPSMSNDFILNLITISNLIPSLSCQIVRLSPPLFYKFRFIKSGSFFTGKKRQHQRLSKFEQINLSLNFGHLVLHLGYFCIFHFCLYTLVTVHFQHLQLGYFCIFFTFAYISQW